VARLEWDLTIDKTKAIQAALPGTVTFVTDATRRVLNAVTVRTPVDTGRLRAGTQMRVATKKLRVRGEVFNNTKYALAVEQGTAPHVIKPKKKKALAFRVGGRVVIVKSVRHPGTKGTHFMGDGLADALAGRDGWRVTNYVTKALSDAEAAQRDAEEARRDADEGV